MLENDGIRALVSVIGVVIGFLLAKISLFQLHNDRLKITSENTSVFRRLGRKGDAQSNLSIDGEESLTPDDLVFPWKSRESNLHLLRLPQHFDKFVSRCVRCIHQNEAGTV